MDPYQEYLAAVSRVQAREKPPEYTVAGYSPDGQPVRHQTGGGAGVFADPVTAAEWLDDRIARCQPGSPSRKAAVTIAAAARAGADQAADAIQGARQLSEWDQYRTFGILDEWQGHDRNCLPAQPVIRAILGSWQHQGLPVRAPGDREEVAVVDLNAADIAASAARRHRRW
jgi:hypothetical protein